MPSGPLGSANAVAYGLYYGCVLADLPAAYWRLANASPTTDESGGGATLVAVGTPTNATGLITQGEARDFNGTTGAYTASSTDLNAPADSFSLELWIKPDSVTGSHTLLSKGADGYQLRTNGTNVELLKQGTGSIVTSTGVTLATGQTYHIVATKDGATSCKLYVNGTDRSGTVTDRTVAATATDLNIARKSDSTEWFDGVIDEVAVYSFPLTADMVTTHYNAGASATFGLSLVGAAAATDLLPRIKVEIAFASNWSSTWPLWNDVTADVRSTQAITINRSGRGDENSQTEPGTGSLVLTNRSRNYDPTYTSGTYGANVLPGRPIRIRACWSSTHYWLFRGWVDQWQMQYPGSAKDAVTVVSFSDILARLNLVHFPEGTSYSEEAAGTRIASVLSTIGVPPSQQNLDAGISIMPAVENLTGPVLSHLLSVADSDGGFLYGDADGRITYETRTYRALNESSSRGIFGDN